MASVNKVILIGNLGADPDTRYLPSGDPVSNIRLATTDRIKDKQTGEYKELTEWHRVAFFGRLAEIVNEYLFKGSSVYIEGRIRTRKYTDQQGIERYSTEIVADQMQMLGSPRGGEGTQGGGGGGPRGGGSQHPQRPAQGERSQRQAPPREPASSAPAGARDQYGHGGGFDDMDDDIPF